MTLTELLVVLVVCAFLILIFYPGLRPPYSPTRKFTCASNLKQIEIAFTLWKGDNDDKYPMQLGSAEGGVTESAAKGDVEAIFQVMSNELATPKVLICPEDPNHAWGADFAANLGNTNISYFVGLDVATNCPNSILTGDDNFEIKGAVVKPGVLWLTTNVPISWTGARHHYSGYIGLADGSVQTTTDSELNRFGAIRPSK